MEPTGKPGRPDESLASPPGPATAEPASDEHWSPFSTTAAKWSWGLLAIFVVIYFVVAVLTSSEFAELAATMVLGLPLGFLLGVGMIIAGLVITRIYLIKVEA